MKAPPPSRAFTFARRVLVGTMVCHLALVAAGILVVALRDPTPLTPILAATARGSGDLARFDRGARVRASSFDPLTLNLPIFLIDGQTDISWTSRSDDVAPWVEVVLPEKVDLAALRLSHAGVWGAGGETLRHYTITCGADGQRIWQDEISGNESDEATHTLQCPGADSLRVDFDLGDRSSQATVYEVELFVERQP